ncbi:hypothetical protein GGI35DRAFT_448684, partial [Trichoderma velutinum]
MQSRELSFIIVFHSLPLLFVNSCRYIHLRIVGNSTNHFILFRFFMDTASPTRNTKIPFSRHLVTILFILSFRRLSTQIGTWPNHLRKEVDKAENQTYLQVRASQL